MKNSILWDCHMHSSFSEDSDTPMERMIQQAISLGFKGICFTEHLDPDYPETPDHLTFSLDLPSYRTHLLELRDRYASQLEIRFGIELGLQPHLGDLFHTTLSEFPFDFVIGSSHIVHNFDPYYPEFFDGKEESACYQEYFESILENLNAFQEMDVYGHLDYIVRYGPNQNRFYSYKNHQEILDEILCMLVKKQIGLELNTGGYHYGLGQPNPCTDILKRYRELGGEIITVGADAHTPEKIGFAFDRAAEVLRDCGFSHYTVFENRKPVSVSL